jgi:PPOX class probable F420-dependent enzyme
MASGPMTDDEVLAFLATMPARTAKLATVRADGRPHVAPVWFDLDGSSLVFATGAGTVKGRNVTRDPRVAISVDDERPPFSFVCIDGTAEISEDPADLLKWCIRIGGRYMGAERAEAYGQRNAVPGELLVRVRATHVTAVKDLAD